MLQGTKTKPRPGGRLTALFLFGGASVGFWLFMWRRPYELVYSLGRSRTSDYDGLRGFPMISNLLQARTKGHLVDFDHIFAVGSLACSALHSLMGV